MWIPGTKWINSCAKSVNFNDGDDINVTYPGECYILATEYTSLQVQTIWEIGPLCWLYSIFLVWLRILSLLASAAVVVVGAVSYQNHIRFALGMRNFMFWRSYSISALSDNNSNTVYCELFCYTYPLTGSTIISLGLSKSFHMRAVRFVPSR